MARVGFVGPGRLGLPMVRRLHAAGHEVTVAARRPEVRAELGQAGLRVVAEPAAAAVGAELVLVCLYSDAQLAQVGPAVVDALPAGALLASHVTGDPALLLGLAGRGAARGVSVLDAPVSGTAADIAAGRLTVLLGGEDEAAGRCTPVLRAYADVVLRTGPLGSALATKLVNNLLFAATTQLVAEAVALGEQLEVPAATLLSALQVCSGSSHAASLVARAPDLAAHAAAVGPFLRKDVAACRDTAAALGVGPGLLLRVVEDGPLDLA
jgi:3-hydroxyisobutyrate dehydrogenase-like beta-hydroxyacid dehydrogenase